MIIVLGETVVGVVNGVIITEQAPLEMTTAVLGLCIGFGIWWNYFDIVGVRGPGDDTRRVGTWFFGHLPQTGAIAVAGAAMVGLVADAHETRTPSAVAFTLGGAVALSLLLVVVQATATERSEDELSSRTLLAVYGTGAVLALVIAANAPPPWLLALLMICVLGSTWLSAFVPPARRS